MISLRVNEILKYLSIDKKEQLKRCVQGMERSDNVRIQKNNIPSTSSPSLTASSSGVSLESEEADESVPDARLRVGSEESTAVTATPNERAEEEKTSGTFKSDKKISKDFKKRRPLVLLKDENIQRMHPKSPSISENSFSFPESKRQDIPNKSCLPDVKPNGLKPLALSKSKAQKNSKTSDSARELPLKTELDKKSENIKNSKGCPKSTEKQKLSKQKNTKQKHEIQRLETDSGLKLSSREKEAKNAESPDPVLCPVMPSPSFQKNRKQNGTKDLICDKIHLGPKNQGHGSVEDGPRGSGENLSEVDGRRCPKTGAGENFEQEMAGLDFKTKKNRSDRMKVDLPKLNGYNSSSGVAELDTFEIASLKKMLKKKQCLDVQTSDALNELDNFDDPVVKAIRRPLNESLVFPATPTEMAEKWIEVNRKVKRVVVPSKAVGRILGSDGSKLEAICSVSKAHIEQEANGTAKETVFVIKGTLEQMQAACNMILALSKDYDSKISHRNGSSLPSKPVLASDLALQNTSKKQTDLKLQHLPVVNNMGNATCNKISSTQGIVVQQQDEAYQDSGKSGTLDGSSNFKRGSPDKDSLMGEYSLFEHGIGQPLEKLLGRKDSTRQTFAHAAGSRHWDRPLAVTAPNGWCGIDQTLLAKAPGYRDVRNREVVCPRNCPAGQICGDMMEASSPLALRRLPPAISTGFGFPLPDRPISAPSQPFPHSTISATLSIADPSTLSGNPAAIHVFSKLNPNAPDFIFASPPEAIDSNHVELGDTSMVVTSEETIHELPIENGVIPSWFHSHELWNEAKMSFGDVGGSVDASYPSQNEVYSSYFAHPTSRLNAAAPYNALYYQQQQQQQNMMMAPIQSWSKGQQTLVVQAAP